MGVRLLLLRFWPLLFVCGSCCCVFTNASTSPSTHQDAPGMIKMGTTLLAMKYNNGVVMAADSRTSVSGYVSNRFATKLVPIAFGPHVHCAVGRSGSAADTQYLVDLVQTKLRARYVLLRPSLSPTNDDVTYVPQVAHYLRHCMREEGDKLLASLLCAGCRFGKDGKASGVIYSISTSGALMEEGDFSVAGSGSTYIMAFLDRFSCLEEQSEEECVEKCIGAIRHAMERDGNSGGVVRLLIMDENGCRSRTIMPVTESLEEKKPKDLKGFALPQNNSI